MRRDYEMELDELSADLIRMGAAAANAVDNAMTALRFGDKELAAQVVTGDGEINAMERAIEERCLRLLLRQQPVAGDLRKISASVKMITDIERIGDAAADISEISLHRGGCSFPEVQARVFEMAQAARSMVDSAITAYVNGDVQLAEQTMLRDDIVDGFFLDIRHALGARLNRSAEDMDEIMDYLMIIKYLERVGDHAVNICEWVEFCVTGIHKTERDLLDGR